MPGTVFANLIPIGGSYYRPTSAAYLPYDILPQMFYVDYTVGIIPSSDGAELDISQWGEHREMCIKLVVREVLTQLSDVRYPGQQGITVAEDGLSQTVQFTRGGQLKYQGMISQIDADYKAFVAAHVHADSPIIFEVI
jgi:hypothetical protein